MSVFSESENNLRLISYDQPLEEPCSLKEAKEHLAKVSSNHDAMITGLITEAREYIEVRTRRQFMPAVYELTLDAFPCDGVIELRKPPIQSVTSVIYYDMANTEQTVDPALYDVDTASEPGRIAPTFGYFWLPARPRMGAVKVRFRAGYAAGSCPRLAIRAMLLLIGHWYENREASTDVKLMPIPTGVEDIINSLRWEMST